MSTTYKIGIVLLLVSTIFTGFTTVSTTHAASYTAVQSGNWNDTTTWDAGIIPTKYDDVTIPAGITVSSGNVERSGGTTFNNHGTLVISGDLKVFGTFNNFGGSLLMVSNPLVIEGSGVLDNAGTINTSYKFEVKGTLHNNGTIDANHDLINENTLNNSGTLNSYKMLNNKNLLNNTGTINSTGTIDNTGIIDNQCVGRIIGTVSGNPPINTFLAVVPTLVSPIHRFRTTNTTPTFSLNGVAGAQSYRLMIYNEERTFELKNRIFTTEYTLAPGEALVPGKYMWRVRTQDANCRTWTTWSGRNTLFVD